jgi:hypothetical protein
MAKQSTKTETETTNKTKFPLGVKQTEGGDRSRRRDHRAGDRVPWRRETDAVGNSSVHEQVPPECCGSRSVIRWLTRQRWCWARSTICSAALAEEQTNFQLAEGTTKRSLFLTRLPSPFHAATFPAGARPFF